MKKLSGILIYLFLSTSCNIVGNIKDIVKNNDNNDSIGNVTDVANVVDINHDNEQVTKQFETPKIIGAFKLLKTEIKVNGKFERTEPMDECLYECVYLFDKDGKCTIIGTCSFLNGVIEGKYYINYNKIVLDFNDKKTSYLIERLTPHIFILINDALGEDNLIRDSFVRVN